MASKTRQGTSSTALKAFRALDIVADSSRELSTQEVADQLGTDKVTAYRMLTTLEVAGYVVRNPDSKRYGLSYKVVSLSRNLLTDNEVSKLISDTLHELEETTGETMHYSVLEGHEAVLIQAARGRQLVHVNYKIGDRVQLHCTSIGKALLAFQDVRFIEHFIAQGLPKRAPKTITDPEQLRRELQKIRAQGYALDDHEFADTMRCIAAPVFQSGGRVHGGISTPGPDDRFTYEYLEWLSEPMLTASRRLSQRLGGLPWNE